MSWQNWRFRFAVNGREGLVLYTVGYEDRGRCVPSSIADRFPRWWFLTAIPRMPGISGLPLMKARTVWAVMPIPSSRDPTRPRNATFFDATLADETGVPFSVPRAVALYERDGGLLWKHFDRDNNHNASRRSRELVLSWIATVGNYDYGFNWVFHQDGTLEMQVLLTGIMETKGVDLDSAAHQPTRRRAYGHLVSRNLLAVHHQHFFNFRLDMDVDGSRNSVMEMNTQAEAPGRSNPYKNAFVMKETRPALNRKPAGTSIWPAAANGKW